MKKNKTKWFSKKSFSILKNKELFLDNDFLNRIYKNKVVFHNFIEIFSESFFIIDRIVFFEFIKSLYVPKEIEPRIKFIKSPFFYITPSHQQFNQSLEKSAIISQIYSNQTSNFPKKNKPKPSFVDLFLAGKLFLNPNNKLLITGNKKDFPTTLFDTIDVITIEDQDFNKTFTFFLLEPNQKKFDSALSKLKKANSKL